MNVTAGNGTTISASDDSANGISIANTGTTNISVGNNLNIKGSIVDEGTLNISAGKNAVLAGVLLIVGAACVFVIKEKKTEA